MSLLPNYELAEIPDEKIYDHCLNPYHERGQHKAKIFRQVFGITIEHGELLKMAIFAQLGKFEVTAIRKNSFGVIYTVPLKISIFDKEAEIITARIVENNSLIPRFLTCYADKK
ncbi:hypothetical protein FW774_14405 [Pedobacter sp. BS3]|uniref:DUF6883 domain-containing protein n=1 Tax=Pedobacter sp. BS3 TaxID=2567937 RepID=UPI0011EE1252|nr:DUF6883 domain-containing protein [Pedobacter sp. BS3]TZF82686.1 hypothetical protein FW774_14405 [Pedobacter sp. BS3]